MAIDEGMKCRTRIVGKGGLHPRMSLIYKYETLCGFIKGVSGGCFVLIDKLCYLQSDFTHNLGPTKITRQELGF